MDTPTLLVSCKAPYDYTSVSEAQSLMSAMVRFLIIVSVIFFLWVYSVLFEISIYNN